MQPTFAAPGPSGRPSPFFQAIAMRMSLPCVALLPWALLGALAAGAAAAEVRPLEFIHALQAKDYHEVVVDYLNMLKQQEPMPPEVAEVWDLEMSKSLRGAAGRAYGRQDFDQRMSDAQKHLDQFLKAKPDHVEAISALVSSASFSVDRALQYLRLAKGLEAKDKEAKAKYLADARTSLEEARPRFAKAVEQFQARLAALPAVAEVPAKRTATKPDKAARERAAQRERLEMSLVNAGFQAALVDYYMAQTYDDPGSDARQAALKKAAALFDYIFQTNRLTAQNEVSVIGLSAQMWHGKAVHELGDVGLAKDIYEEVLVNERPAKVEDPILDRLFADVRQHYFAILARENPAQFLEEAVPWLDEYARKSQRYEGYQAVSLEVAKMLLGLAEQSTGAEKKRLVNRALPMLARMARIPSPSQQEAFALHRKYAPQVATDVSEAKNFEEAVSLAISAAGADRWREAADGFAKALDLAGNVKDKARVDNVRNDLARCRLMMASDLLQEGKPEEGLKLLSTIVTQQKDTPVAPAASALRAQAALGLYAAVPDGDAVGKQRALQRLQEFVAFTESNWPGKAEADDARMALGKVSLVERRFDEAIATFEKVDSRSERYPVALLLEATCYWQRYLLAKTGAEKADAGQMAADRAKALDLAQRSLAELARKIDPAKPPERHQIDTQLLLADVALEGDTPQEAIKYVQSLVDAARASKSDSRDGTSFRVLYTATRAYLAAGDAEGASGAGMALADLGADVPAVNGVLVHFARTLDVERKKADAALTKATSDNDQKAVEAAKLKLASAQQMMGSLLKKLASRKNHTLGGLMAIADLCYASGFTAEASRLYDAILKIPNVDKKAATRARAQLVGLLRTDGKFEEAYKEVHQLIQDNPKALEPQIELGRVLQTWGEKKDPRHFHEAASQWIRVRNWLQPMRKKPAEYYEVVYNAAYCLAKQAEQDPAKARQLLLEAIKLLKGTLTLNEKLSGPDMVEKYKALLDQLEKAVGQ